MTNVTGRVIKTILATLLAAAPLAVPAAMAREAPAVASPVTEVTVQAGSIKMHYLRAGTGSTMIILLHGWPESSHEWHRLMPLLSERFTVIAPDLRGIGGTDAPPSGYDKATMAEDIYALIGVLKPVRVVVVGHDIGAHVAYSFLRLHPSAAAGIAILDVPIPGTPTWTKTESDPRAWHFGLNTQDPLAEELVTGRQALYFRYFVDHMAANPKAVSDADIAIFAKAYGPPARLKAGFGFYRAFDQDKKFNAAHVDAIDTPVLLAGGDHSMWPLEPALQKDLAAWGVRNIKMAMISNSGHWIAEEQPDATAKVITDFVDNLK